MSNFDEAVEAAAKAFEERTGSLFDDHFVRDLMRHALEAATPHMLTRITNYVINRAYQDGRAAALEEAAVRNPYRSQA